MTQTLYAHMNNKKKKLKKEPWTQKGKKKKTSKCCLHPNLAILVKLEEKVSQITMANDKGTCVCWTFPQAEETIIIVWPHVILVNCFLYDLENLILRNKFKLVLPLLCPVLFGKSQFKYLLEKFAIKSDLSWFLYIKVLQMWILGFNSQKIWENKPMCKSW
jgi:hypothetical protein